MGFAMVADERAIRSVHDSAVGADDIRDAPVFQRARSHFVWLQTLRITSGDVAPQPLRDIRTKLGRDARLRVFQERKDRRRILKNVTYGKKQRQTIKRSIKIFSLGLRKERWERAAAKEGGGETENGRRNNFIMIILFSLPVKIISGRHNRSIDPGTRLLRTTIDQYTSRRVLAWCDAKCAPFTILSRLFDILLNMAYLPTYK